jgi:alkanesulfonate monooxygenase SsuD/methylene tetrahydromethanopterin reductase-like flavin-dependent oxidoreductase (luciferase family)
VLALWLIRSEAVDRKRFAGLVIGFAGVVALVGIDFRGNAAEFLGAGAVLLSALSHAGAALLYRRWLADARALGVTALMTAISGAAFLAPGAVAEPKPVQQPHPPIWIGGAGRRRTLRIAAQHASVWNAPGGSPEEVAELSGVLDRHCADIGRDPGEIRRSVQVRLPATPDELLALAAAYAAVGVTDLLLILHAADPVAQAGQAGELLPRLRAEA